MGTEKSQNTDFSAVMRSLAEVGQLLPGSERQEKMKEFLEAVAEYTRAQKIFIYECADAELYECTYKYSIEEAGLMTPGQIMLTVSEMKKWYQRHCEGDCVITAGGEDSQPAIVFPISHNTRILGYMILENPDFADCEKFIETIPVIGGYLGSIRMNYQKEDILEYHEKLLGKNEMALNQERQFLEVLCRDYTSVYYVDLFADTMESLKIDQVANAAQISELSGEKLRNVLCYTDMIEKYCSEYVVSGQIEEFRRMFSIENLERELKQKERVTFRYQSVPNLMGQQYFETQVVRLSNLNYDSKVLIGFRHVDDLVAAEEKRRHVLEETLTKLRKSNETLSAIGKIYYTILRIDLNKDRYAVVSSIEGVRHLAGKNESALVEMRAICNTFVVPEYRERIMHFFDLSTLQERLENEETIATEYYGTDGNWHTGRFIVQRREADGQVSHVLYVARLISDAKRREQNWIAIAEAANRANEAKTEFVSQVAHDIRTPMNAIMGFAEITGKNVDNPEKVRYGLGKIKVAGNFLLELVDEVLDISRIEDGKIKIQPEPASLKKVLEEFQTTFEQVSYGRNLKITYKIHNIEQDCLEMDSLRLKQIYTNIMSNAVKYTTEGGSITFECYEEPAEDTKKVRLITSIRDTGIGMSEDYMKKMYTKFSRETDTRINKVRGYGLGLSIVKQLTDLMDGEIEVTSKLGEGTNFKIILELPCLDAGERVEESVSTEREEEACAGKHLLVAEDNPLNYEVLSELLKMYGMTCDWAEDGAICVEKFQLAEPHTYDAILMDMQMPVMDGISATKAIRRLEIPEASQIPIIAMTANAFKEDIQRCMDAGMNAHLSKPIDMQKLLRELV